MQAILPRAIIGLMLTMFYICNTSAQTPVYYGYDGAGNRVIRSITLPATKSAKVDSSENKQSDSKIEAFQDNLGDIKILIYPNPTKGQLKVDIEGYKEGTGIGLYLYSLSGSLAISKPSANSSNVLELSGYPIGTYILKIVVGDKKTEWKIVKE